MQLTAEEREQIGKARSTGGGAFLGYGRYILMVERWFFKRGYKGLSDIHEFVVAGAEKTVVFEEDKKIDKEPNAVDSKASMAFGYFGTPKAKAMAPVNTTAFALKLFGVEDGQISDETKAATIEEATNDDPKRVFPAGHERAGQPVPVNPCRGMVIGCEVVPVKTEEKQRWIAAPKWFHIARPGEGVNTFEEAAKRWSEYEARLKAKAVAKNGAA